MRQGLNVLRRRTILALRNDVTRGVICSALLVFFWIIGLPLALTLLLPVAIYGGIRLLSADDVSSVPVRTVMTRETRDAYAACLALQSHLTEMSGAITDATTSKIVQGILVRIEQILDLVAEEAMYLACLKLLEPLRITDNFLSHYLRLIRRGHDVGEMKERVRENLSALDRGFADFQMELNQEAAVDFEKLGDTIIEWVSDLPVPPHVPRLPPELPASVVHSYPPHIAPLIAALTPREISILRILTTGMSDKEIADMLFIAPRTVTTHLRNIYTKIMVRNRAEAAAFAVRWGLMPPDETPPDTSAVIT